MSEDSIELRPFSVEHLRSLQHLNAATFPVSYSDRFYADLQDIWPDFTRLLFHGPILIGAISCRLERTVSNDGQLLPPRLYIMTLAVLAPYRRRGFGKRLLDCALQMAQEHQCVQIFLHVQTSNQAALRFYRESGFARGELIRDYYKRIQPPDCYLIYRDLTPT
jgi:ribosomal protein S18 acetylase RimI-like enzyme